MRFQIGESGEKVLVDATEDVAVRILQGRIVEDAQQAPEHIVVEFLVFILRKRALERLVVLLDQGHRVDDGLRSIFAVRPLDEVVELRLLAQKDCTLAREVFFRQLAPLAAARRQVGFDFAL